MMRFDFRAAASDRTGYYYTRWDRAIPISVDAEDRAAAEQLALKALGDPPRGHGWKWSLNLDRVAPAADSATEIRQPS